ncbi:MAG: hypothetical protein FWF38_05960 [Spirochaetaceae bacterium]|nr:hypothetical protein [Spirochaetaceae bacterium]
MKHIFLLLFFIPAIIFAEAFYSPTWGFGVDIPEGYDYIEGDGKDKFSFGRSDGLFFDLIVYNGVYKSIKEMVDDVNRKLGNQGDVDFFDYHGKEAAIVELNFGNNTGWGLCVTLAPSANSTAPMLLVLSYNAAGKDMNLFHMSALDSITPTAEERRYPGPIMEYSYPRGEQKRVPLAIAGVSANIRENDAEAAQVLIEREFNVLKEYLNSPYWKEAWIRYYRFIYRDSFARVADAASIIVRSWGGPPSSGVEEKKAFAQRALSFVQDFDYERNLDGSDFVNMVTAITEGRGDCDSRAMLWAIILAKADIRAAMMVSHQYSHAMGLADIAGQGARFETHGTKWLVAETTAKVDIGLIAQDNSDVEFWIGIIFE